MAPLARVAIFTLPERHAQIVFSYSHLILDGPSHDHVLSEIARDYDAACAGRLHRPPASVSDRAFHLRPPDPMAEAAARAFWLATLDGLPRGSPLAALRCDEAAQGGRQARAIFALDESETAALVAARSLGCAPGMIVYAAWALVLHRISQEREIAFLAIRNGRSLPLPDIARMVGPLVTSVPLHVSIDRGASGAALVSAVARRWRAVTAHEHTPLGRIAGWTGHGAETWTATSSITTTASSPASPARHGRGIGAALSSASTRTSRSRSA